MKAIWTALVVALSNAPTPVPWAQVRDAEFPGAKIEVVRGYDGLYRAALDHDKACDAVTGGVPDEWYSPYTELGWFGKRQLKEPYRTWVADDEKGARQKR